MTNDDDEILFFIQKEYEPNFIGYGDLNCKKKQSSPFEYIFFK